MSTEYDTICKLISWSKNSVDNLELNLDFFTYFEMSDWTQDYLWDYDDPVPSECKVAIQDGHKVSVDRKEEVYGQDFKKLTFSTAA